MPRFEPFPGIRFDDRRIDLADVTAPPYDVIDPETRAALAARHTNNVVVIDCPAAGGYVEAADSFRSWLGDGTLIDDAQPSLYLYRMAFTDDHGQARHTTGVIGAVGLEPHGEGDVLAHEHTTPRARSDRLELLRETAANLSPIWFLSLAQGLTKLLDPPGDPVARWTDDAGVSHSLWRLSDPAAVGAIVATVESAPLVIADGHHRYETCLAYQAERRRAASSTAGDFDLTLGFVVELVEDELDIEPIHRLVTGLHPGFDVVSALSPSFEVGPVEAPTSAVLERMDDRDAMAVVLPDGLRLLWPGAGAGSRETLDTSRIDAALATLPAHELVFQPGVAAVLSAVAEGRADAGFLVRPPSIGQIADVAHRRQRMPPKTTFFWPKPRTGLVFRALG